MREGASPLPRQFKVEAFVVVREAKMAGSSCTTPTSLETVASTASAGMVTADAIAVCIYRPIPCHNRHKINMTMIIVVVSVMVAGLRRETKGNQSYDGYEIFHR